MGILLTIIVFILVLGLLVFVHEFGHFITAKRAGIKVEEFGFGFPPKIFSIKKGETIYSLNLLPIGGFVKIYGENGRKKGDDPDKGRAFYSQPIWRRVVILVAGVTMNFILAAFLLGIGHWIGLPTIIQDGQVSDFNDAKVQIIQIVHDSPADISGVRIGDSVKELRIGNHRVEINTIVQAQEFAHANKGQEMVIIIQRGDQIFEKSILARASYPENEGPLGIALAQTATVSYSWYKAIWMGFLSALTLVWVIVVALSGLIWQLLTSGQAMMEGGGPVYIFNLTGQAAQLGFIYVLQFTAILSINLAIINILPFPALDGGRLVFLLIEKIKGSPVSQKIEGITHTAGFIILIMLMVAITWRDIIRVF